MGMFEEGGGISRVRNDDPERGGGAQSDGFGRVPASNRRRSEREQTAAPTSKYQFGMFIEHIGPLIYRSLWSEMLMIASFISRSQRLNR